MGRQGEESEELIITIRITAMKKNTKKGKVANAHDQSGTRIADFLFEIGTMRKLLRIHRQPLLTDDTSDNIASHSYRVAIIGWILAKMEGADAAKVLLMCMLHDIPEVRSNDHNWIHKKYVKIFEDEIVKDQLETLPGFCGELATVAYEYHARLSKESVIAKDADLIDQVLLLREYEWQGNKEAALWLHGKDGADAKEERLKRLKTKSAVMLCSAIYDRDPSAWWNTLWTPENRK